MSELTLCNFCQLRRMRRYAKERGVTVKMGHDDQGWVTARYSDEKEPSAYYREVPERCAC